MLWNKRKTPEMAESREPQGVDELTGSFNRAAFDQQLEQLAGIGMLLGERPWLILIELDGFDDAVTRHGQEYELSPG